MSEPTIKERPILFSAPMVRALLDGRKTQTRRIVTPQTSTVLGYNVAAKSPLWQELDWARDPMKDKGPHMFHSSAGEYLHVWCKEDGKRYRVRPRVEIGDRLWVREHWGYQGLGWSNQAPLEARLYSLYHADGATRDFVRAYEGVSDVVPKQAPGLTQEQAGEWWKKKRSIPAIHMPRWASRITLEVTDVRVERVQQISAIDASAEGMRGYTKDGECIKYWCNDPHDGPLKRTWQDLPRNPRDAFKELWQDINGPRGFGWDVNPWVWVVSFKRVDGAANPKSEIRDPKSSGVPC